MRGADQLRKDALMATQGATLGRNAPPYIPGQPIILKTFELRVPGASQ